MNAQLLSLIQDLDDALKALMEAELVVRKVRAWERN